MGVWSGSLRCNSSTLRFFHRHITTQEVLSSVVVERIRISIPLMPRYCMKWTWRTCPIIVCPNCCTNFRIWICTMKCVISACRGSVSKNIICVRNGFVRIPTKTLLQNDASSQTSRKFVFFSSGSNLWRLSRNPFPDAGLSLLGVSTKEFTSCGFTFSSSCSFSFATKSTLFDL